ncbi:MAG: UDP-N-acetylmuramoyl-tripeptide--D-alanyl-D-alanine ligase [Chitinophagaceae bacterium]|nr:UDP-N-acetylmuramoyl-tripeptide--D-alanyl-D-alanine ligase [Chitinophagaceae bacterium]MCB9045731.1 UDP-N-acetylmuramoyl-tripeptide--D-alanyl-D-alanine ligase [Chitinophagales bacterium]
MEITELYKLYLQHPSVQTDTRKLKEGDIYFALKGPNFNGNTFALQALDAGASYAVVDEAEYATNDRCILVADVLSTLQALARHHRQQLNIPFIAITGSNGKTTTKELVTSVLQQQYKTHATRGNLNNHIGVPLTLLSIPLDTEMAVIEMGANHQKEIASYCEIALPTHGIINNCGKAHIEGFGGIEGVRKGKGELYDYLRVNNGTIFRNTDLDYLKDMAQGIGQQITYGSANATYVGKPLMDDMFLKVAVLSKGAETSIPTHLVGEYNFPNVMVAVAVGLHFDISIDTIKTAIGAYNPDNSRSQWMQMGSNQLILDAYNANPTSMRAAIINFAKADLPNKMLWLGGMKEMGNTEEQEHKDLVALIQEYNWSDVILVGKEFNGITSGYTHFNTSAEAKEHIATHKPEHASILVKGSRSSKMEVMTEAL